MNDASAEIFKRSILALGERAFKRLNSAKVAVLGVGGVGGWCAESLVRAGVGRLIIVDPDRVAPSNINRQLVATTETVGELKVNVLEKRLLAINPNLEIDVRAKAYTAAAANEFDFSLCDVVIDAIDSLDDKVHLIKYVTSMEGPEFFSSMGAAFRTDPFAIRKDEFWKVKGDGLARALRNRFRKTLEFPRRKFMCVYSAEAPLAPEDTPLTDEARAYGSLPHVTASFGFALAALAVNAIVGKKNF
ncbi:MAG: ThiF family adenylyltransferase [Kiritimatiellae bacterium]|nr:ThiF family adenylyltransferase [Kiritimatiellia bacterium]